MDVVQLRGADRDEAAYPYFLPAVQSWESLPLQERVTFFVGENGSGKSTLIEAIAIAAGFNAEGGSRNFNFSNAAAHSPLHQSIRLVRGRTRPKDGYFLRAESFFNVASNIDELDGGGAGPRIIESYGGASLHTLSHGESFMALMRERFGGHGFYVLDEPEAALSPKRQLAFLRRLHELVRTNSQFVIATHSPLILAYPDAWIYAMTKDGPVRTKWSELEHVMLTRDFLNHPDLYLWNAMESGEED